jgi:endonuclease G, mitochondrial
VNISSQVLRHQSQPNPTRTAAKAGGSNTTSSVTPQAYEQPPLDELFEGSKPKWGATYNKYISSTQVPHSVESTEYYDPAADQKIASEFYANLDGLTGQERMQALRGLVSSAHTPEPKGYHFTVAAHLYKTVDRHQDGTVRSVYNKEPIKLYKYPDISLDTLSEKELSAIPGACASSPEVIGAWLAFQHGNAELNCEHVVPQSYFDKAEPMRSDLHHLYACDIQDNSSRGSTPYGRYQPVGGRGEVARATLYFMLRYPDVKTPYRAADVEMLKQWSEADPPETFEKRRNHEIQKVQGNRNPFIDHPEWLKDFHPK